MGRNRVIHLDSGACRGLAPEMFDDPGADPEELDRAREICAACPIRLDCLALALQTPDLPGIWGGLTAEQRAHHRAHLSASAIGRMQELV